QYIVQRGDTVFGLARQTGVTVDTMMQANCLATSALRYGEPIYLPASPCVGPTAQPNLCDSPYDGGVYTVVRGDTLYSLARRLGLETETLQKANCLGSSAIYVGQTLHVPGGASASLGKWYPAPVLLAPDDVARFAEGEEIPVRWSWDGELAEDEHFDVRLWREGAPHYGVGWAKDELYAVVGDPGATYYWAIAVIRGKDGKMLEQLSPESEARKLFWGSSR
ncbi:MAG: LysM peptidoglycan-binding domain-containing protein, partial [Anaerolineae bacterium]